MATPLPHEEPSEATQARQFTNRITIFKQRVDFRLLLRNLEKSKANTEAKKEALNALTSAFCDPIRKANDPALRKAIGNVMRWVENNRNYLDQDVFQHELMTLDRVLVSRGYPSILPRSALTETIDKFLQRAYELQTAEKYKEALSVLDAVWPKIEENMRIELEDNNLTVLAQHQDFQEMYGHCCFGKKRYIGAIESYTEYLSVAKLSSPEDLSILSPIEEKRVSEKILSTLTLRGASYFLIRYYEEAKSDLKKIQLEVFKTGEVPLSVVFTNAYLKLAKSFLYRKRYKHALRAAYQLSFWIEQAMDQNPPVSYVKAWCLYENKKFKEAQWICSDWIDVENYVKSWKFPDKYGIGMYNFLKFLPIFEID